MQLILALAAMEKLYKGMEIRSMEHLTYELPFESEDNKFSLSLPEIKSTPSIIYHIFSEISWWLPTFSLTK
jgi:hypothetical protein